MAFLQRNRDREPPIYNLKRLKEKPLPNIEQSVVGSDTGPEQIVASTGSNSQNDVQNTTKTSNDMEKDDDSAGTLNDANASVNDSRIVSTAIVTYSGQETTQPTENFATDTLHGMGADDSAGNVSANDNRAVLTEINQEMTQPTENSATDTLHGMGDDDSAGNLFIPNNPNQAVNMENMSESVENLVTTEFGTNDANSSAQNLCQFPGGSSDEQTKNASSNALEQNINTDLDPSGENITLDIPSFEELLIHTDSSCDSHDININEEYAQTDPIASSTETHGIKSEQSISILLEPSESNNNALNNLLDEESEVEDVYDEDLTFLVSKRGYAKPFNSTVGGLIKQQGDPVTGDRPFTEKVCTDF